MSILWQRRRFICGLHMGHNASFYNGPVKEKETTLRDCINKEQLGFWILFSAVAAGENRERTISEKGSFVYSRSHGAYAFERVRNFHFSLVSRI